MNRDRIPELATFVCQGLRTENLEEDRFALGAYQRDPHSPIRANITGIAYIGKVGVEQALNDFGEAVGVIGDSDAPINLKLAEAFELGKDSDTFRFLSALAVRHCVVSANAIALQLEAGDFLVDQEPPDYL